jgi:two-component system cell cycle response regulator
VRTKSWLVLLVVGAVAIACYPAVPGGVAQSSVGVVLGVAAAVAIVVGVRVHRPARQLPWLLIALGQLAYTGGSAIWLYQETQYGERLFPSYADVSYLLGYPLIVAGLVALLRVRRPGRDLPALLDAATIATGLIVVVWTFIIGPWAELPGVPTIDRAVILAYPVGDVLVLCVAARLVAGAGLRTAAERLLLASLAALLIADAGYLILTLEGTYAAGGWVEQGWQLNYLLWAVAALHPSLRELGRPLPGRDPWTGVKLRLVLLAAASLMPATVHLVQYLRDEPVDVPVLVTAQALLFAFVMLRMNGLFQDQERLARTDWLTGVYNRRFFSETLAVEMERAERAGRALGLLVVDVDHFKRVNDRRGHAAGDRVLAAIADRLSQTVLPDGLVTRYGGEEFAVLLPGVDAGRLTEVAECCRRKICEKPLRLPDGSEIAVTVSIGAAAFPANASNEDALMRIGDGALYSAKRDGRNRVVVAETPPDETDPESEAEADDQNRTSAPAAEGNGDASVAVPAELRLQP